MKYFKKHTLILLAVLMFSGSFIAAQAEELDEEEVVEVVEEELPAIEEETVEIDDGMEIYPNLEGSSFFDEEMSGNYGLGDSMGGVDEQEISTYALPSGGPYVGFFTGKTSDSTVLVFPTSTSTSRSTYITNSGNSGVFGVLDQANGRHKIAVSGVIGWVDSRHITLQKFNPSSMEHNFYRVRNGELEHLIASHASTSSAYYSNMTQGDQPSYLSVGNQYLSFDGQYFYPATVAGYNNLIKNYNAGNRNNAINKNNPYINYFQWVSARSQTKLTANDFRRYLTNYGYNSPSKSRLYETEQLFLDNGSYYGGNAALGFSTGIHESGWGTSQFSRQRNNYFGHNAYDSSPGMASAYATPNFGIGVHFGRFWNWNYLYAGSSNHHGSGVGNKGLGMNVMYASDPYWGEKIAAHYYAMDKLANQPDYKRYDIGFLNTSNVNFRKDASTTSGIVYEQREAGIPITIIEKKTGTTVNGSNVWYGFSSEAVLDKNKNQVGWSSGTGKENISVSLKDTTIYVHSSFVDVVSTGKDSKLLPQSNVKLETTPTISKTATSITTKGAQPLRPDPSEKRSAILTIPSGTKVSGYTTNNGYAQVLYNGQLGFIKTSGTPTPDPDPKPDPLPQPGNTTMYTTDDLNMRSKPVNGSVITTVPKGSAVKTGTAVNGWVHATYNGKSGYMSAEYLTKTDPTTPNSRKLGDINGDGKIDAVDLAMMQAHMRGIYKLSTPEFKAADINKDGKIDAVDLAMMQSHMRGLYKIEGW